MKPSPTVEQVKEHFKDAEIVRCLSDGFTYKLDLSERIQEYNRLILIENQRSVKAGKQIHVYLWSPKEGFAPILEVKSKEFAYAVYPDSIRMDLAGKNDLSAVFRNEKMAHKFGGEHWGLAYRIKPVSLKEFLKLEEE
jgi:hypothetical protein